MIESVLFSCVDSQSGISGKYLNIRRFGDNNSGNLCLWMLRYGRNARETEWDGDRERSWAQNLILYYVQIKKKVWLSLMRLCIWFRYVCVYEYVISNKSICWTAAYNERVHAEQTWADSEPMAVETLTILLYNFCRDLYVGTHSWTVLMDINPSIIKHSENMIKWPGARFFQTPILYSRRHSGILAFHNIAASIIFTYKQWCWDFDSSNYYHSLVKR